MFDHRLRLVHDRRPSVEELGRHLPARSTVDTTVESENLTEAWRELLTRLPSDVYMALKMAMEGT